MKTRKFFILFVLCCGLPFVAAKLYLESGLASEGETNNKGQWLKQEIQLFNPESLQGPHWYLVYIQSESCEKACEHAMYTMQQIYTGFGRKQINIKPMIVSKSKFSQLSQFPSLVWQEEKMPVAELQNTFVIVNQKGLALLQYPVVDDMTHMASVAKDIRTDLQRLINYDRGVL